MINSRNLLGLCFTLQIIVNENEGVYRTGICSKKSSRSVRVLFKMVSAWDIAHEPAADVAEVRHGRWIENTFCSCCGGFDEDDKGNIIQSFHNYCPNCGARMDKGGLEDETK